jgi:peptidoglycan/LPS O-acetylase OafA/YrhL
MGSALFPQRPDSIQCNCSMDKRIQSLDGLRAIAICAVISGHLYGTISAPPPIVGNLSRLGVVLFFVISGFLITGLLLKEQKSTGTVSLRGFYFRRVMRIVPAFLVFVFAMIAAQRLGWIGLSWRDIVGALTWTVNYMPDRSWSIGHLWSLSVEEQFYLLWPASVALLGFALSNKLAIGMFFLAPAVRAGMHILLPHSPLRDLEVFPAVCDAIAIGCIIAIARDKLLMSRLWRLLTNSALALPLAAIAFAISTYSGRTIIDLIGTPFALLAIAAIVEGSTRWSGIGFELLNNRPIIFMGHLSYSLYLWQQPFLNQHIAAPFTHFPLNICTVFVCALGSYNFIEKPFLKLRCSTSPPPGVTVSR